MGCGGLISMPDCRQKPTYKESRQLVDGYIYQASLLAINS